MINIKELSREEAENLIRKYLANLMRLDLMSDNQIQELCNDYAEKDVSEVSFEFGFAYKIKTPCSANCTG